MVPLGLREKLYRGLRRNTGLCRQRLLRVGRESVFDRGQESPHVVTAGKEICGLVTQTDIMRAVRRSSEALESQQSALNSELADLRQRAIRDRQRTRDFLSGIPHPPANTSPSARSVPPALEPMVSRTAALSEAS